MADEVVQGLSAVSSRIPSIWTRQTVADGKWLQKYTLTPLSARDVYLAEQIDNMSATVSAEFETLEAATDVVDVIGSLDELDDYDKRITKNDVIKVLNATGSWSDPVTSEQYEFNGEQVYFRYTGSTTTQPDSNKWTYVGELNPYYSKSEIDNKINIINENIDGVSGKLETLSGEVQSISGDLDSLSSTISSNYYLSGNVKVGTNLSAAHSNVAGAPVVTISTKDKVSFTEVSATGFSGTNISGDDVTANIDDLINGVDFVKYHDTALVIGKLGSLTALDPSTALGFGVSSKEASFGIGTDSGNLNRVSSKSFVYGEGNSADNFSISFGVNNLVSTTSFAGGVGNSAYNYSFVYGIGIKPYNTSNNIFSFGKYPNIGEKSIFTIGNGRNIENKHNVLNLNNDGTLQLYDFDNRFEIVNTAAKIYSSLVDAEEYIGITQGWDVNSASYTNISSKTLLCFGPMAATFNLTIGPPGSNRSKKFRIMRCLDDWWNLQIGIASGYDICFKNFNTNNLSGGKEFWYSAKSAVPYPTTSWDPNLVSVPIGKSDCYMEIHDTESSSHFFNLKRIYNNTYFDVEVDTKGKVVVFIKGGFVPDQTTYNF